MTHVLVHWECIFCIHLTVQHPTRLYHFCKKVETMNGNKFLHASNKITGHQYTWSNDKEPPTFKKLDRVLMTTQCEHQFQKVNVGGFGPWNVWWYPAFTKHGLYGAGSETTPISFRFGVVIREGFFDMLRNIWQQEHGGRGGQGWSQDYSSSGSVTLSQFIFVGVKIELVV